MVEAACMSRRGLVYHAGRRARARLMAAALVACAVGLAIPARFGLAIRILAGWDAAALALGLMAWAIITRFSGAETRGHAAADDPGRAAVSAVVLVSSAFSLFASTVVLRQARALAPHGRDAFVVLCMATVIGAWFLTHTAYTLRYAHLYYRDGGQGEGGLSFPGAAAPEYIDFAYFAFTIGMCFQVSDVAISSSAIRRTVLSHSILSFAYNTAIVAVALNLVLGVLG
jgi:uncharacterized membrane protein